MVTGKRFWSVDPRLEEVKEEMPTRFAGYLLLFSHVLCMLTQEEIESTRLFLNPKYSDLTIVCGNESFPVY